MTWLSAGAWDPLHIFTVDKPIRSLADMQGLRVFGVPTAGKFLSKYGLVPVTIPWDNVEVAMQTGELDGVAWCGFTEAYEVGWADVCKDALTNSVTGAWFGSGLGCCVLFGDYSVRPYQVRLTIRTLPES